MLDVLTDSFLVIYKLFQEQTKAHHAEAWKEKQAAMFPFIQHERLEWDAHCNGVHAYHAWVLERTDGRKRSEGLRLSTSEVHALQIWSSQLARDTASPLCLSVLPTSPERFHI